MALGNKTRALIQRGVDEQIEFRCGNIRGQWYNTWDDVPKGRLSYRPPYMDHIRSLPVYVIFSYETPIAWGWLFPSPALGTELMSWVQSREFGERYSRTTSHHQNIVAMAIANMAFFDDVP